MESKKIVLVGDPLVGIRSLCISCKHKDIGKIACFTGSNHTNHNIEGREVTLKLYDTPSQEEYKTLRPFCYPGTDVFLVCYSIDNVESLEHAISSCIGYQRSVGSSTQYFV